MHEDEDEEDDDEGFEFISQSDSLLDTLELKLSSLFVLELELIGPVLLPLSK